MILKVAVPISRQDSVRLLYPHNGILVIDLISKSSGSRVSDVRDDLKDKGCQFTAELIEEVLCWDDFKVAGVALPEQLELVWADLVGETDLDIVEGACLEL